MKFAIFTHVPHVYKDQQYYAYGPYVKEMNIWVKYVEEVIVVGPVSKAEILKIDLPYLHDKLKFETVPSFSFTSLKSVIASFFVLPKVFFTTYKTMKMADHLHLRCPGNVGLVACLVQILFPAKIKTAKYAGNWDPNSKQPWSYRFQKWILSNTLLTRNMSVLVYGDWEGSSKNIVPFFTATYKETDKKEVDERTLQEVIRFLYAGTLSKGKKPLYAVTLVQKIKEMGFNVCFDIFGEGAERENLEKYVLQHHLSDSVILHGNQPSDILEKAYQSSHFLLLPSQSEGWPKVVAEAMFWGCVPVSTKVSCVPYMLGFGKRGVLLTQELNTDIGQIVNLLEHPLVYKQASTEGMIWSRQFTLDKFEQAIAGFLKK